MPNHEMIFFHSTLCTRVKSIFSTVLGLSSYCYVLYGEAPNTIVLVLIEPDLGLNPRYTALKLSTQNITQTMHSSITEEVN